MAKRVLVLLVAVLVLLSGTCFAVGKSLDGALGVNWKDDKYIVAETALKNGYVYKGVFDVPERILRIFFEGTVADKQADIEFILFDNKLYNINVFLNVKSENIYHEYKTLKDYLINTYGSPYNDKADSCFWMHKTTEGNNATILLSIIESKLCLSYAYEPLVLEVSKYRNERKEEYYREHYKGL